MPSFRCPKESAIVIAVDLQPNFLAAIHESDRVVKRSRFLIRAARQLEIPILTTEQNPSRMGSLEPSILGALGAAPISKMAFSCYGSAEFRGQLEATRRKHVVLVGIETHICVTLTAIDLIENGYTVFVCPDAVSSRTLEMHKLGMERMRDSGVTPSHTESLVYEWMGTADHPEFRQILKLVKEA
jgi:nicotinamidase-related amidase